MNNGREPLRSIDLELADNSNRKIPAVELLHDNIVKAGELAKVLVAKAQAHIKKKYADVRTRILCFNSTDDYDPTEADCSYSLHQQAYTLISTPYLDTLAQATQNQQTLQLAQTYDLILSVSPQQSLHLRYRRNPEAGKAKVEPVVLPWEEK
jgi:hypothetical protein